MVDGLQTFQSFDLSHKVDLTQTFALLNCRDLCEESGKFLVIEDLEAASRGDLAHLLRVEN